MGTHDDKAKFGVIGLTSDHVWGMGDGLVQLPGVRIVAAADETAELRDRAARQWGLDRTYASHAEMLEREDLGAVLVCCDNASKAGVVEAAARHGVHVYQDKPMSSTLAGADRILQAAKSSGITLMVAYHSAFNPIYDQVKQAIADQAIGTVYLARGSVGHEGPVEFGCSPHFYSWLFDAEKNGGGTFVDEACYVVDEFVDYLGNVVEVSAFTAQIGHRDYLPKNVEDNAVAILRFASGALGVIDSKWGQVGPAPVRTSYHGTEGTIVNSRGTTELATIRAAASLAGWSRSDQTALSGHGAGNPDLRVFQATATAADAGRRGAEQRRFIQALVEGAPLPHASTPDVARHVQEIIDAVYVSAASGRAVSLPLKDNA